MQLTILLSPSVKEKGEYFCKRLIQQKYYFPVSTGGFYGIPFLGMNSPPLFKSDASFLDDGFCQGGLYGIIKKLQSRQSKYNETVVILHYFMRRNSMTMTKSRKRFIICAVVLLPVSGFLLYIWAALTWSFSAGERAGYITKFSSKGWICKTWEGELTMALMPGTVPEKFLFTVRNDLLARRLLGAIGKPVSLTYEQHKGVPTSCFGETEYFATDVKLAK